MSSSKFIVIVGATGNQGSSVASVFLEEPGWKVRALTRNTSSTKSQALAGRGAEVVQADIDTPATLSAAFEGANTIFAVSDFLGLYGDPANKDKVKPPLNVRAGVHETQQLKNNILSSMSDATKWSKGEYTHVYHFDSKAKAEVYGRETYPDLWAKTSIYQAGLYLSNYTLNGMSPPIKASIFEHTNNANIFKNSDGVVQFIVHMDPDVRLPFAAAEEDTEPLVKAPIQESAGKKLTRYQEWLISRELALKFTKATGMKAEVVTLPKGYFLPSILTELKAEVKDNMAYWNDFWYEGRDDPTVIHPRDLNTPPSLDTVEDYLKKYDWTKVFGS
ncbi:LOW QUALITY PROTEIN: hypothetical protein IFM46972_09973 [Aspergillus udagawae]|uniref:NmrA-like domain-containing protein n=1 Tax=Aspergillus udagawae TaxID=91492 RepID=A0A8H3S9I3_9EURO|nr:LOW QUALITY PROTEIN: hypothetical protein IFM46972_09973 [Aspergillus udagawae]